MIYWIVFFQEETEGKTNSLKLNHYLMIYAFFNKIRLNIKIYSWIIQNKETTNWMQDMHSTYLFIQYLELTMNIFLKSTSAFLKDKSISLLKITKDTKIKYCCMEDFNPNSLQ